MCIFENTRIPQGLHLLTYCKGQNLQVQQFRGGALGNIWVGLLRWGPVICTPSQKKAKNKFFYPISDQTVKLYTPLHTLIKKDVSFIKFPLYHLSIHYLFSRISKRPDLDSRN